MTEFAKISVVIPLLQRIFLYRGGDSFGSGAGLAQLGNFSDDGSSDRPAELVRDWFPHIELAMQASQGVAAARNNGITHAQGDRPVLWLRGIHCS